MCACRFCRYLSELDRVAASRPERQGWLTERERENKIRRTSVIRFETITLCSNAPDGYDDRFAYTSFAQWSPCDREKRPDRKKAKVLVHLQLIGVPLFSQHISYRRHRGTCGSIPLSEEYHSFHLISDEDRRDLRALRIELRARNRHPSSWRSQARRAIEIKLQKTARENERG